MEIIPASIRRKQKLTTPEQFAEHDHYLSLATQSFAAADWKSCIVHVRKAICAAPSADAFQLLFTLYRDRGLIDRAMDYRLLQAHMAYKDLSLWEELLGYYLSVPNGAVVYRLQVIYILGRVMTLTTDKEEILGIGLQRAGLLMEAGEGNRARTQYEAILRVHPHNIDAITGLASLHYHLGNAPRAVAFLTSYLQNTDINDLGHICYAAGLRAEIQTETGRFQEALDSLVELSTQRQISIVDTPVLCTRYVTALVMLAGHEADAEATHLKTMEDCMSHAAMQDLEEHYDMYYDAANNMLRIGAPKLAMSILGRLSDSVPVQYARARASRDLGDAEAVRYYVGKVYEEQPHHVDSQILLASVCDDPVEKLRILREHEETDPVLALRLCYERAKVFYQHDPPSAVPLLQRIMAAVLRDPPVDSVADGEGGRKRTRRRLGAPTKCSVYASSTIAMTRPLDMSGRPATPAESVATSFRWESRPHDRPAVAKSTRFDTSSVRSNSSSHYREVMQGELFQFHRSSKKVKKDGVGGGSSAAKTGTHITQQCMVPPTQDAQAPLRVRTEGSVGNERDLEDVEAYNGAYDDPWIAEALAEAGLVHDADGMIEEPQPISPVIARSLVLNWTDAKIALGSEADLMAVLIMVLRLAPSPGDSLFYITSLLAAPGRLTVPLYKEQTTLLAVRYAVCCENSTWAMQHVTKLLRFSPHSAPTLWNGLCYLVTNEKEDRRILERWLAENADDSTPRMYVLTMLCAHTLGRQGGVRRRDLYEKALSLAAPDDPLPRLCLAIEWATGVRSRSSGLSQTPQQMWEMALAFHDEYWRRRKRNESFPLEGMYNLARLAQHVGLTYVAVPLYQRILRDEHSASLFPSVVSLRRCAAMNLSLIYRQSGNAEMAHAVLWQNVVVQ